MIEVKDVSKAILVVVRILCIRDIRALSAEKADKDESWKLPGIAHSPSLLCMTECVKKRRNLSKVKMGPFTYSFIPY